MPASQLYLYQEGFYWSEGAPNVQDFTLGLIFSLPSSPQKQEEVSVRNAVQEIGGNSKLDRVCRKVQRATVQG